MEALNIVLNNIAHSIKLVSKDFGSNQSIWYVYKDLIIFCLGLFIPATYNFFVSRKISFENKKTELRRSLNTVRLSRIENVSIMSRHCRDSIYNRIQYGAPSPIQYDESLKSLYHYRHDIEIFKISFETINKSKKILNKREIEKIEEAYKKVTKYLDDDYERLFKSLQEHFITFNQVNIQLQPSFYEHNDLTNYSNALVKLL